MNIKIQARVKQIAFLFSAVYFASYVMRINFAVMLVKVCADLALQKTDLAIVITGLTVTYGAGQVISGLLGDRLNPRHMLTAGLSLAILSNVAMFFFASPIPMTAVWCVNGFGHALLWPPIVRMMSTTLNDSEYSYAAIRVSWGSSGATVLLYLVCPLLLTVTSWRFIMLLCALLGTVVLGFWIALNPKLLSHDFSQRTHKSEEKAEIPNRMPLPKFVYVPIVFIALGIVLQGILRDGVTNWMPSYLAETFSIPAENAIVSTVILAIFSMISFMAFDLLHRKVFRNEVFCSAVIFGGSAVCAVLLYFVNTLFSSLLGNSVVLVSSMLLMALIVGAMHGINLMLITVVPKRFVKTGKVSTYSGLLNACTYIGAALSSYGFAAIAESFGWNTTILTWIFVSLAGLAVCLGATLLWERFKRI